MTRFVTWNILDGATPTVRGDDRMGQVLGVLAMLAPDVLVLQEANDFDKDDYVRLHLVENRLGMRGFLALADTGYHLAVLIRRDIPILSHFTDRKNFFHSLVGVTIQLPGEDAIQVLGAHLCPHSTQVRLAESQHLVRRLGSDVETILLADLNAPSITSRATESLRGMPPYYRARYVEPGQRTPDTRVAQLLEQCGLVDVPRSLGNLEDTIPTGLDVFGSTFGGLRLDHIYASSGLAAYARAVEVVRTSEVDRASDHFPVLADFNAS